MRPSGKLRTAWRGSVFASYAVSLLGAYELRAWTLEEDGRRALRRRYSIRLGEFFLELFGAEVLRSEPPSTAYVGPRLVVANHRSGLDIGIGLAHFGGVMLSRADVADWAVLGRLARLGGTIFVDRSDKGSGARAIRSIRSALREGETVTAFPEGTTFSGDEVRPFQPGAFAAVHGLAVPIVPVGFAYDEGSEYVSTTFGRHLLDLAARERTRAAMVIGEPFETARDTRATTAEAHRRVQALVREARARHRARWLEAPPAREAVRR